MYTSILSEVSYTQKDEYEIYHFYMDISYEVNDNHNDNVVPFIEPRRVVIE